MMKTINEKSIQKRAEKLMEALSGELNAVRNEIAKSFPAYNSLLNLHAMSFEEFALLPLAREKNLNYCDVLFNYRQVVPSCPICTRDEGIVRKGIGMYYCNHCNKKFKANHDSISSGFKLSSLTWRKILHCMLNFYSLRQACDYCDITATTYYNIRNRIFYAMQLMMDEVKLYGNIQCDNTFVHLSYKGSRLQDEEYPEDSPFSKRELASRSARKRGGSYSNAEKNKNSICIFTAIDECGHVMVKMVGVGVASAQRIYNTVGSLKYLYTVPEKDPFDIYDADEKSSQVIPGTPSCLISDGESAIKKYAEKIQINFESNIYRKNGKQLKLGNGAHDIQRVNSLHSRLKSYLRKLNYVSSKYLPGFLVMFEFIENTGASEEAIGRLFEILARPNGGKDALFFRDLYAMPKLDTILVKPETENTTDIQPVAGANKAFQSIYLYDLMLRDPKTQLSLPYISQITGYAPDEIKRSYDESLQSGLLKTIRKKVNTVERGQLSTTFGAIPIDFLIFFDEYAEMRKQPISEQIEIGQFVAKINRKHQKDYSQAQVSRYFQRIVKLGLRPPLPEKKKRKNYLDAPKKTQDKYVAIHEECQKRYVNYRQDNQKVTREQIYIEMAREYAISSESVKCMDKIGRNIQKYRMS